MEQVSEHVFIDPDYGGCTVGAIRTRDAVVLVDSPKQPSRAVRWRDDVSSLGDVRYLINTEHHIDHTFGNGFLPGTVIAHKGVADRFWEDSPIGRNPMKEPKPYVERTDPEGVALLAEYSPREPEVTFADNSTIRLPDVTIELLHVPGHTAAETNVYVREDRVLFASDNVFNDCMIWYHDALPYAWLKSLQRLQEMQIKVVVPGHGQAAGPELLEHMHSRVKQAVGQIEAAVRGNMSRAEATESVAFDDWNLVAEDHKPFAERLQKYFIEHLYDQIEDHVQRQV